MKRSDFWTTAKRNWRTLAYLLVLTVLAVVLVVVCVRRGQDAAQPSPTPRTSAKVRKDAAQALLDGMSTREKICQLLIVHPEALTDGGTVTAMTDDLAAALRDYPVGGFLLSAGNLTSGEQLRALTSALSSACAAAPLVTVDEEGGRVARLMNTVGTTKLNSMYSYRSLGTQGAYDNAQTLAHDIAAYGFNTDFAPVADAWTNKRSNAIGDRAYSDDYDEAATLVSAAVHGFRDAGVICCLKHFPGHGSTATDSHNGAATVDKTLPQLRQEDLKPFVSGIAAGADMEPARVRELFCSGSGYQTPKLDTRAAIFDGDRILLVRERDGRWALPGGWVDVGLSIAENAVKEVREEAGLEVEAVKLIALQEHNRHNRPARAEGICTAIVLCRRLGGEFQPNIETTGSAYFAIDELPELAEDKTTAAQIRLCFAARSDGWQPPVD